jgi:hypothetical protein
MHSMKTLDAVLQSPLRTLAALFAFVLSTVVWNDSAAADFQTSQPGVLLLSQNAAQEKSGSAVAPTPAAAPGAAFSWTFGAPQSATGNGWVAERGTLTVANGEARLKPDANRRVVLLSPTALPDAVRYAEAFVLGVPGTGLQRVRIQGRRDARGGWITIADASGTTLAETTDGYVVKRSPGARGAPIERLRIELTFRTTNPRALSNIATR